MRIEKEELKLAYSKLPENIRQIFDASETSVVLINIGKKYGLHIDQVGQLTTLVHYVLLGLLTPKNFVVELKGTLGVSEDIANLITYDLNQQILIKIRRELEELSRGQKPPVTEQELSVKKTSMPQVFDQKMKGVANVPKQEVAVTPQTGDNKVKDPYREPII